MKWIFLGLCLTFISHATPREDYLHKFIQYREWKANLPPQPNAAFIQFINKTSPLSNKLREAWLYRLAYDKKWSTYTQYYQPTQDINLQCYEQIALYQQGQQQQAIASAQSLWLKGHSQPKACDNLFALLFQHHEISNNLIHQRIVLALRENNINLAAFLLIKLTPSHKSEIQQLMAIHQRPMRIIELKPSAFQSEIYLYGLTRLIANHMDTALKLWQLPKTQQLLNHTQQQIFLAQVAHYKAMRNHPDASAWFSKVTPSFYNDTLLSSQIRFALKNKQWSRVESLIEKLKDKAQPCWQYWLARAKEARMKKDAATSIYQTLSKRRNYYGFLASLRLHQRMNFENERAINNTDILKAYQPITQQIKTLYITKQTLEASRLLNDFMSELPKNDQSALAYWIAHHLQWHGKSVYLSNNKQLNNQLSLRFPLAYQDTVVANAKNYQIPKELIYAIIRQESAFSENVISSAGAHGLMQLMPATAKAISKEKKIAYVDKKQLFSPHKNITIGTAYLQQLHKRFKQHPVLIAAAYNAGPRQAAYWLKNHSPQEMDIWIETLPWQETRNYLKNVIAFYAVYQYRLQEKPNLSSFMKPFQI